LTLEIAINFQTLWLQFSSVLLAARHKMAQTNTFKVCQFFAEIIWRGSEFHKQRNRKQSKGICTIFSLTCRIEFFKSGI